MKSNHSPIQTTWKQAFTLIELLSVIAVLAILAAILIPVIGSIQTKIRTAHDATNLRQIANANLLYASENSNRSVVVYTPYRYDSPSRTWYSELRPYLDRSESREGYTGSFISPPDPSEGGLSGPNAFEDSNDWRRRSYSVNYSTREFIGGGQYQGRLLTSMDPAKVIFIGNHKAIELFTNGININQQSSLQGIPTDWHTNKGSAQFAFMDGYIEMIEVDELMPEGEKFELWAEHIQMQ